MYRVYEWDQAYILFGWAKNEFFEIAKFSFQVIRNVTNFCFSLLNLKPFVPVWVSILFYVFFLS